MREEVRFGEGVRCPLEYGASLAPTRIALSENVRLSRYRVTQISLSVGWTTATSGVIRASMEERGGIGWCLSPGVQFRDDCVNDFELLPLSAAISASISVWAQCASANPRRLLVSSEQLGCGSSLTRWIQFLFRQIPTLHCLKDGGTSTARFPSV